MSSARNMHRRAGALYVAVLLTSLVVSVATVAGLAMVNTRSTTVSTGLDAWKASTIADSMLAIGLSEISANPNWATELTSGSRSGSRSMMDGNGWYMLTNSSGDLTSPNEDEYLLIAGGQVGETGAARQLTLDATYDGVRSFESTIYVGDTLNITRTSVEGSVSTDGPVSVGLVNGTAVDWLSCSAFESRGNVDSLKGTSSSNWASYYLNNGTEIPLSALKKESLLGITLGYVLEKASISATNNPFCPVNGQGIYFVRCNNKYLKIQDCRIEGTLVVLDVNGGVFLNDSLCWAGGPSGRPCLLVDGKLTISADDDDLDEASVGVNFNPLSAPYRGTGDTDLVDRYPSIIEGLVYCSGDCNYFFSASIPLKGTIVAGGDLNVSGRMVVYRNIQNATDPPPGFRQAIILTPRNGTNRSVAFGSVP